MPIAKEMRESAKSQLRNGSLLRIFRFDELKTEWPDAHQLKGSKSAAMDCLGGRAFVREGVA